MQTAFGRSTENLRSSRSAGSRRSHSAKKQKRSRSGSPSRSASRSKSKEGQRFIQRIEKLRKNLEVEGQAIQTYYKKADELKNQKVQQSEKQTAS